MSRPTISARPRLISSHRDRLDVAPRPIAAVCCCRRTRTCSARARSASIGKTRNNTIPIAEHFGSQPIRDFLPPSAEGALLPSGTTRPRAMVWPHPRRSARRRTWLRRASTIRPAILLPEHTSCQRVRADDCYRLAYLNVHRQIRQHPGIRMEHIEIPHGENEALLTSFPFPHVDLEDHSCG